MSTGLHSCLKNMIVFLEVNRDVFHFENTVTCYFFLEIPMTINVKKVRKICKMNFKNSVFFENKSVFRFLIGNSHNWNTLGIPFHSDNELY